MAASKASKETLEKVKEAAKKMGVSIETLTEYAKKIRKDGEKWTDALRRAYQEMK
jgi:transposase